LRRQIDVGEEIDAVGYSSVGVAASSGPGDAALCSSPQRPRPQGNPLAIKSTAEAILQGLEVPVAKSLQVQAELSILLRTTEDWMTGARAFSEKHPTQSKGR
jgi:enoyl-CoA hydratase/carnithine racemase